MAVTSDLGFRLRAFGYHFVASALLLTCVLAAMYLGWYAWPAWYLTGAEMIVGLMVLVDLGIGPVGTLVVARESKSRRELRLDIGLIVLVQLAALTYGGYALWVGRPLYYAFAARQVNLVAANDIAAEDVTIARSRGVTLGPEWHSLPRWVWAPMPEDPREFSQLLINGLLAGKDIVAMPQYYRPLSNAQSAMQPAFLPVDAVRGRPGMDAAGYGRWRAELPLRDDALGLIPVVGRGREGVMVFERATGMPVGFAAVRVPAATAAAK